MTVALAGRSCLGPSSMQRPTRTTAGVVYIKHIASKYTKYLPTRFSFVVHTTPWLTALRESWTIDQPASSQKHTEAAYRGLNQVGMNSSSYFVVLKIVRYTGRPSPYYKESHRKLRDYVRAWCDEVRPNIPYISKQQTLSSFIEDPTVPPNPRRYVLTTTAHRSLQ